MKKPTWEIDLVKYLSNEYGKPFEWGIRDCTTLIIGALQAMTDTPLKLPLFGYRSKEEAIDFAQHFSLYDGMIEQLNAYLVTPNFQQSGDIIFVWENETYPCVHLCTGEKSISSIPGHGVKVFPTSLVIREGAKHRMKILRFD